jgi:biopolymer transport protein ExbD
MSFPVSKSNLKRARKPRGSKNLKGFKPQLTSLVDLMTVIVVYLVQSFSTEGQIITVSKDLTLPESSAKKPPVLNVNIIVTNKYVLAEDVKVANVDDVLSTDDMVIPQLYEWLGTRREMTEKIEKYSTKTKFKGDVTIQGDKRIRFRLLKKIMYTCGQQGFNNFNLAVQSKGE